MALLVVPDPDAESYVSVADFKTYCDKFGKSYPGNDTAIEQALRRGTQYVDTHYRFKGEPEDDDQPLEWPRVGYPWPQKNVVAATCEAAFRELSESLYADVDPAAVIREKIDVLEFEYTEPKNGGQKRFTVIDELLRSLTLGGGQITLVRA